jgi:hypothetical protein
MVEELNKRPKVTFTGLILLFGSIFITGVMIGVLTSFISNLIYLILIFPVLMGMASGFVINSVITSQKIRSPFIAIIAGLFATAVVYGSMHIADYLKFRSVLSKEIQNQVIAEYGQEAEKSEVQAFIDYILVEETGTPGFVGYILLSAKEGVSISSVGPGSMGDDGVNLGAFTWVYWLIEIVIIAWISIAAAYGKTKEPFCEHCDAWVAQGDHIGGIGAEAIHQGMELFNRRDFVGLLRMLREDTEAPSVEFYIRTCKTCSTFPTYLTGVAISLHKGQPRSKLLMAQALNSSERHAVISELGMPTGIR